MVRDQDIISGGRGKEEYALINYILCMKALVPGYEGISSGYEGSSSRYECISSGYEGISSRIRGYEGISSRVRGYYFWVRGY